jgi:hypothetical protein
MLAGDLAEDVFRITGWRPDLATLLLQSKDDAGSDIVIGVVVGHSALLDRLAKNGRIDLSRRS